MFSSIAHPSRRIGLVPVLLVLGFLFAAGVALGLAPGQKHTALADNFQTVGHFGFFALVAIASAVASTWLHPKIAKHRVLQYAFGLAAAVVMGGLLEFAQKFIPRREPSWNDLAYDSLGGIAGILLMISLDWRRSETVFGRRLGNVATMAMLAMLAFGTWPFVSCARDYWYRDQAYPLLMKFEPAWIDRFLWIDESVERQPGLPEDWPASAGREATCVLVRPAEDFPGLGIIEPYPDWRGKKSFAFDVLNPNPQAISAGLRIHDFSHNLDYYDRFNRVIQIQPGFQTVRVLVADIEHGPRRRPLDLSHIEGIKVFLVRPTEPMRLCLGNFRLD